MELSEDTVKRLKEEGYSSEDIKQALQKMKEDTMQSDAIETSLDDCLDSIDDDDTL